jgi:hypothetical protein
MGGLSLDRQISLLVEHIGHWIPGLAESQTSVPVKVSGVVDPSPSGPYMMVYPKVSGLAA